MTDADLKAIQARADAATPGPWEYGPWGSRGMSAGDVHQRDRLLFRTAESEVGAEADDRNGAFVAHARADVPALLAEVRLLRGIVADQQKESGLFDAGFKTGWRSAMETAERVVVHYGEADASGPSPGGAMTAREFVDTYQTDQLTVAIRRMANDGDLRQHASTE